MINTVTNYNTSFLQRLNINTQRRDISTFLISSFGYCMLRDIVSLCLVLTVSYFVQWLLFLYVCLLLNCVKYQLIPISIWELFCVFNYIDNKSTEWRTIVYHCHCYCFLCLVLLSILIWSVTLLMIFLRFVFCLISIVSSGPINQSYVTFISDVLHEHVFKIKCTMSYKIPFASTYDLHEFVAANLFSFLRCFVLCFVLFLCRVCTMLPACLNSPLLIVLFVFLKRLLNSYLTRCVIDRTQRVNRSVT